MIFTNHRGPEGKSHITHYENSNHAPFSLGYSDPIKYDADNFGWAVIRRHRETPYATLPMLHSE